MPARKKIHAVLTLILASATFAGCTAPGGDAKAVGSGKPLNIAFLAASSQNAYNKSIYDGAVKKAESLGNVTVKEFDGSFDPNIQLSQLENLQSGQFDGVIVVPNDGVSLASAFPLASGIPVVTITNPIGPDILKMENQVDGVLSTIGKSMEDIGRVQAEGLVEHCKNINPCNVAIMVGYLSAPLDVAVAKSYNDVLAKHSNIHVVSTTEGGYERNKAMNSMANVLQANPGINGVLSIADQQTSGLEVALSAAGVDPSSVYLTGTGGTADAVNGIRSGKWKSTYAAFTVQRGEAAVDLLYKHHNGEEVPASIDADTLGPVPAWITSEVLKANPQFESDWNG